MRNAVIIGVVLLVLGGMIALFSSGAREGTLDISVMGVEGLGKWLPTASVGVVRSHPRRAPRAADLSLRILPLYDVDLERDAVIPKSAAESARQSTQRDISAEVFFRKLENLPTLVVFPKWLSGFATTEVAHTSLLIGDYDHNRLIQQIGLPGLRITHGAPAFETARLNPGKAAPLQMVTLYHAQLFRRDGLPRPCREVIGFNKGALLIYCDDIGYLDAAYYLSDPDILNNHGLSLAENAGFAVALINGLRPSGNTRPVYLDTGREEMLDMGETDSEARPYTREAEDFARFFSYPLSVFWGLAAVILGLTLWRGVRRFGPSLDAGEDRLEASKTAAIDAKARLLRLSGNDGRMAREFVQARLADLAAQTFGAGIREAGIGEAGISRLFAHLASRDPGLAAQFSRVTTHLIGKGAEMPPTELHRQLETFRDLLERVTHGPARVSKPD